MPTTGDTCGAGTPSMRGLRPGFPLYWSVGFLLLCFFGFSSSSSPPSAVQGPQLLVCNSKDRDALVGFSKSLASGIPRWPRDASSSNCCGWSGVRCDVISSSKNSSGATETRVVALELGKKGLNGVVGGTPLLGLDELRTLNLSQNSISGVISAELFFRLPHLEVLDLSTNNFGGQLSDGIGNLSALSHLDISVNDLSGSIPDVFVGLRKLQVFSARSNRFSGPLPASLSSCSMLTTLDLGRNSLNGTIGLDFPRLVRLRTLRLDWNRFVGRVPRSLSSCRELETLNLARNNLHGQIPWRFKHLQGLSSLSLAGDGLSNLSRAFAVLSECRNLTFLVLTGNFIGEAMPGDGIGGFERLKVLVVADCALLGPIPLWIRSFVGLRLLDLSFNQLAGKVPAWLGDFARLFYLDLSHNSLRGVLPDKLANLKSLTSLDYSHSDSSPMEIPFHARRGRSEVQYNRISSIPSTLDMSHNEMDGPILKGFGKLIGLIVLNLTNNNFSGPIPQELSGMFRLETLDLSFNNLSGTIPHSLDNLTFLSEFSVAYNQLEGQVPESRQFLTFSNSSYEGNPGLCGGPLGRCTRSIPMPPDTEESRRTRITFMPLPYGIGVLIGFIPTLLCGFYVRYRRRKKKERQD